MNHQLATYLFGNDTLYTIKNAVLVDTIEAKPALIIEEKILEFKHQLLVISYEMTSQERDLLIKILSAIGLNFDTIDLIELKRKESFDKKVVDYQNFITQKITKKVISFDAALAKVAWNQALPLNEVKTYGTVDFLLTNSLNQIEENLNIKKALWANLQKLFPKNS